MKLDELIRELCPNGVEFSLLGELCKIETGKLNANAAVPDGEFAFFTTAKEISRIDKYRWDTEALLIAGNANVGDVKHYIGKFDAYQRTYVLTQFDDKIRTRYLYYVLSNNLRDYLLTHKNDAAMTYIVLSTLTQFRVPVPPIEVQREIVRILDNFAELTAELTARKKQYEFYRDKLLAVKSVGSDVVLLGDIASIHTGSKPDKILDTISEYEYINAGTSNSGYAEQPNCDEDTVTTPSRGQGGIGYIGYQSKPFYLGPLCYAIRSKSQEFMINKYIYHWLISHSSDILTLKNEGGTPALNKTDLAKIKIVAPPLSIQQRIVNVLDNFDAICSDLNIGLPAEIEARQKQYEYYRDKLLSFKELKP